MYSNITPSTVFTSAALTLLIFAIHQAVLFYRKLNPYKKDKTANQSLFFVNLICEDYFLKYQRYLLGNHYEFNKKLAQVSHVLSYDRMKSEEYRKLLQPVLRKHHSRLEDTFVRFQSLRHTQELDVETIEAVVKQTNHVMNLLITDINLTFSPQKHRD